RQRKHLRLDLVVELLHGVAPFRREHRTSLSHRHALRWPVMGLALYPWRPEDESCFDSSRDGLHAVTAGEVVALEPGLGADGVLRELQQGSFSSGARSKRGDGADEASRVAREECWTSWPIALTEQPWTATNSYCFCSRSL